MIPLPFRAMSEPVLQRLETLAWIAAGAAACAWVSGLEPNMLEEGISLHLAQRMMRGEHLFRDLASFTGPLPYEGLALLFRALGDEVAVARGAVVAMHGLACGAVYSLVRGARHDGVAHLADADAHRVLHTATPWLPIAPKACIAGDAGIRSADSMFLSRTSSFWRRIHFRSRPLRAVR